MNLEQLADRVLEISESDAFNPFSEEIDALGVAADAIRGLHALIELDKEFMDSPKGHPEVRETAIRKRANILVDIFEALDSLDEDEETTNDA